MPKKVGESAQYGFSKFKQFFCEIEIHSILTFYLSEQQYGSPSHVELLSVPLTGTNGAEPDRDGSYVSHANEELNAAQEREKEADYSAAVQRYRAAVDILMKGVQGKRLYYYIIIISRVILLRILSY